MNQCRVCQMPAEFVCSSCKNVHYCNRNHQRIHWKHSHKNECVPFKLVNNDRLGRHFVAIRDIEERGIILRELPLIVGPKTVSKPICLGCNKNITNKNLYRCPKCDWPLCGNNCSKLSEHKAECEYFTQKQYKLNYDFDDDDKKPEQYGYILALRCLLLKKSDKKKYDELLLLEAHVNEIKQSPLSTLYTKKIVPFIKETLQLQFDEEEILRICGILFTNSFEIRNINDITISGVYPKHSMVAHDCTPNTKHTIYGDNHEMVLIATVPIKKGEIITTTYTQPLWGTLDRRVHLKLVKFFECACDRCSSKDEFGTYAGSIYCSKCFKKCDDKNPKMLSMDSLDPRASWKCEKCDRTIPPKMMVSGNASIKNEVMRLKKNDPKVMEEFLDKYKETLHQTNYHMLEVKYALSQIYGNLTGYTLNELSIQLLDRKIEICTDLIEVADTLLKGSSRFRGILMYDLQAAMVIKAKKEYAENKITLSSVQETIAESLVLLKEAAEILKTEPDFQNILEEKMQELYKELDVKEE